MSIMRLSGRGTLAVACLSGLLIALCGHALAQVGGSVAADASLGSAAQADADASAEAPAADPQATAAPSAPAPQQPEAAPAAEPAAAAAPATAPAAAPAAVHAETAPWVTLHRGYNMIDGSTGGFFLEDPGMAEPGSVRLQFALGTFSGEDMLYEGDEVERTDHRLSVSFTALEFLEIFGALQNRGVTSDLPISRALHTLGDLLFGAKLGHQLSPLVRLGGSLRFNIRNDIGPDDALLDSTSIGLRGDIAFDFLRHDQVPIILRGNIDYVFDNSARAIKDIEDDRYASLGAEALPRGDEVRHLISRVERYGNNVNRVDLFTIGLGVELPIELSEDTALHPLLEYRLALPANRQGYDCAYFSADEDRGTSTQAADDTCLDDAGLDAWPMSLALGARFVPAVRGLSLALGVDFGITGTDSFVRELAPNTPFELWLVLGYDYDARPQPPPPVPPAPPAPPPMGRVEGVVYDAATNVPIAGATVALQSAEYTPLATNIAGRFVTYQLPPGQYPLALAHPEYVPGSCTAFIGSAGGVADAVCTLAALPTNGSAVVTVRDVFGTPIAGVRVMPVLGGGPTAYTDADGEARLGDLAKGEHTLRFESDGHLIRTSQLAVAPRSESRLEVALVQQPAKPSVSTKGGEILAAKLKFQPASTQLVKEGAAQIAELADFLLRNPSLGGVRIKADGEEGLALSRALSIKQALVDLGVAQELLDASSEPASRVTLELAR